MDYIYKLVTSVYKNPWENAPRKFLFLRYLKHLITLCNILHNWHFLIFILLISMSLKTGTENLKKNHGLAPMGYFLHIWIILITWEFFRTRV